VDEQTRGTRWVLGFDGGCSECNELARRIAALSEGRVEIKSLNLAEVAAWREQALGSNVPWTPTLFAIKGGDVQAWTGSAMTWRLAQLVSPASAWSVVRLLRQLRDAQELDEADDPSRRRAIEFTGKAAAALSLIALERGIFPTGVDAQTEAARVRDVFKDLRLELASRREQAKLAQRWRIGREERAYAKWMDDNGYRPVEGGKLFFYLVYRRGRLERSVAARAWQKSRNEGAVVFMALEGNREKWVGVTFDRDRPKLKLTIGRDGRVDEERFNERSRVAAQQDGDSATCNTCEVLCVLLATGVIVGGSVGCWLGCGAASVATLGAAAGCVGICIALTTYGVVTGPAGCPGTCENLDFCPER